VSFLLSPVQRIKDKIMMSERESGIQSQEQLKTHPYPLRAAEKAKIVAMRVVNSFLNVYVLLLLLI
jgi:hypothetical protein